MKLKLMKRNDAFRSIYRDAFRSEDAFRLRMIRDSRMGMRCLSAEREVL